MTVKEYNKVFLPQIDNAKYIASKLEHIVSHMDKDKVNEEEVWRIFKIYGWSDEVRQIILKALEYYRIHEGIEKLE